MINGKLAMGVLGLGEGRSIISAVLNSDYYELGAICDLNKELCEKRMKEFGLKGYTTSYDDMLRDESIDVIGIYTPDPFHGNHIMAALEAGKHVICTKPVLTGLNQAKELLACQERTGKQVFVGQSSRFFEPLMHQRSAFEEGKLGELVSLETHYKSDSRWFLERPWSKQPGFSWMYNFMIHAVDLAAWYLPKIEEVFGYGVMSPNTKAFGVNVEDTFTFLAKDQSGKYATIEGAYTTPCLNREVEVPIECTLRGTNGISRGGYNSLKYNEKALKENIPIDTKCYDLNAKTEDFFDEKQDSFADKHGYYFRFEGETHHAGEYQNYIEYFAKQLSAGAVAKPDLKEGVRTIAVMEAMNESLKTGQAVKVEKILKAYDLVEAVK